MNKKVLTIAIPFYNGFDTVSLILNELTLIDSKNFEIIISDDFSDILISQKLQNLILNLNKKNNIIIYQRNNINLGMDLNFCKCIDMSTSHYTWFMGQDDFVYKKNVKYIISLLIKYKPSVAYLNYIVKTKRR